MKKKKTFMGLAVFTAVLVLGIGYAISSTPLNITGTATASGSDENFVVKFDKAVDPVVTKTNNNSTVTATITDDNNATITVEDLSAKGDTATAKYTIRNDSPDLKAALSAETEIVPTSDNGADYFTVDYSFEDDVIDANATTTVTVTVKLEKTPINTEESANIKVNITADPVQPE